jgi:uroporphyrin-3 C-methyltransferase
MNDTPTPPTPPTTSPFLPTVDLPTAALKSAKSENAVQPPDSLISAWRNPWLIVALLALGLAGWQWVETRLMLSDTQQELARRLAESDASAKESRALSKQAQEQVVGLQGKFGALEAKLAESQSQQATLENLYQELARNRDEWALAEVEQNVTLAAQQLQLAGNVQGAMLALQTADARLTSSQAPQFIGLRKVLNRDLDRLRTLPQVDMPGMNLRLENVIALVDTLPLAIDARPRAESKQKAIVVPTTATSLDFWQRLGVEFWEEIRGLVRIQRFDRDEPALLAPGQAFFLRENFKLRLLNARLALLAHDQTTFRNELRQAQTWTERYFDARDKSVQTAQSALKQLLSAEISSELPTLNESLSAIKNFKLGKDRK